ncbi:DUF167 domain-containing protein [Fimbriimonas ginsengisoli]|uniref:UPF0235 protein OP10G_0624 n=1 Tax=Fimbriimonas ginsengisoli Gsoil 348 TaxID=661478 RepID=A0A068NKN3_FIMGI|nr:DUF167 domain-containing protein [Fimbriimonas ginsengisoli]AIE83992.1 hypothetical protein OP10G_0624 [Fimbriimonas ginsengisoli Gsoil 348]
MPHSELKVRVTPRSSRNKIEAVGGQVKVWVTASPTDGQANDAVCRAVADALDLPRSAVSVKRGHTAREKTLTVEGLPIDEVLRRIA